MKSLALKRPNSLNSPWINIKQKDYWRFDDWDVDSDLNSESKVNLVYDSSKVIQIKNSLIISKGSPKRDLSCSISPKYSTVRGKSDCKNNSFQLTLHKSKTVGKSWQAKKPRSLKTCKEWGTSRKPSIEILLTLQRKLAGHNMIDIKRTEDKLTPEKILPE